MMAPPVENVPGKAQQGGGRIDAMTQTQAFKNNYAKQPSWMLPHALFFLLVIRQSNNVGTYFLVDPLVLVPQK